MAPLEDPQTGGNSGGEDSTVASRSAIPRPPSRRNVASSDGTTAHPLLAPASDEGPATPASGSYAVYSPGKKRASIAANNSNSSSSITSPLSPNDSPLAPSSASSAATTPPFAPTTAAFLPPLVSRPSNSTLPSPSGRQYARSVSEAKEKLQKQALKAELQGLGLSAESAGSTLVNKLASLGEDADFRGLQAVLASGKTTLLLPAEKLDSPTQLTPSFVLDHLVLFDAPASGSSAAIERPFVTLSGLRGVLGGGEVVFTSCAAESQRHELAEYASEDFQRQLRGVARPTNPPTTAPYPSNMLISAITTLSIPQSRSPASQSAATSRTTTSRLAALFSKPTVAETGVSDLPPVVPAPAGLLAESPAPANDAAPSTLSPTVDVPVLAVGKVVRHDEVLASLRSATSAHVKALVRNIEGAHGEADVSTTLASLVERFCPASAAPATRTSGKPATTPTSTSATSLLDADPLAVADAYQEAMHAVRLDLTRNIGSAPSAPADSSVAPSLEDFSQLEERVDASLEKIEQIVTSVLYDRLFALPSARDLQEDENLASRIAALNVLELDLEHLGLDLGDEEGLVGWEGRSSNARDSLEDLAALVGKALNRLEDPEERTPSAKLAILVECHKILVDGLSKLPPIPLKKEVAGDDRSSLSEAPAEVEMDDASSRSTSLPPSRPMSPPPAAQEDDEDLLKTPRPPPAADNNVPAIKLPDPGEQSRELSSSVYEATSSSLFDPIPASSPPASIFETKRRPPSTSSVSATSSADLILPILIYSVVRANPPHLVSHLRFINRFRSESLFRGQASYCATNFDAVVEWSQHVDLSTLGLSSARVFAATASPPLSSSPSQSRPRAQTTPSSLLRARVSTTADQLVDSANSALSGVVDSSYRILFGPKGLTSSAPKSLDDVKSVLDGARGKARGTLPFRRTSSARDFPTLLVGRRRGGSVASGKAVTIAGEGDERGLASTSGATEEGATKSEEMVDIVPSAPSGTPTPRISTEEAYAPPPPPLPPRSSSSASTAAAKDRDDSDSRSVRSVSSFLNFRESTLGRALGEVRDGVVGATVGAANAADERGASSAQPSLGGRLLNRFSGGGPATSSSASQGSTTSPSSSRRSTLLNPLGGVHLSPWGAAVPSTSTATHSSTPLSPVPASPLNSVILSAPAYQPVQRFLDVKDAGELRIGEVQELLEEYRRLVKHLQETASREGMEAKEEGEGKPTEEKAVQADSSVAPSGGEEA